MQSWTFLTSFGDAGLMVPTALIIAVWLYVAHGRTAALLWTGLFTSAGLLVAATKIAFLGFGLGIHRLDFTGISGHSMMSMAVFPVALPLLFGSSTRRQWLLLALGAGLALAIAVSRVVLHLHSPFEAVTGLLLGAGVAGLFLTQAKLPAERERSLPLVSLSLAAVFLLGHGHPAPSQDLITDVALALSGRDEPYTKAEWWAEGTRKAHGQTHNL
jgi:membrane-associated phospholipid phosphatase